MAFKNNHTKGEISIEEGNHGQKVLYSHSNRRAISFYPMGNDTAEYDIKLHKSSYELRQIAEMFYDYLKSKGDTKSIVFTTIRDTLIKAGVEINDKVVPQQLVLIGREGQESFEQKVHQIIGVPYEEVKENMWMEDSMNGLEVFEYANFFLQYEESGLITVTKNPE